MNRKFDAGTSLVALGALVLLVALFLDWFTPGGNAWQVFEVLDLVLAAIAVGALAALGGWLGEDRTRPPAVLAAAALVIVAVQLIDPPPIFGDAQIENGAWLALGASVVMLVGAILTLANISVTVDVREREARRVAAVDLRTEPEKAPPSTGSPAPDAAADNGDSDRDQRTQPFLALSTEDDKEDEPS
jgi:hypothetical protein